MEKTDIPSAQFSKGFTLVRRHALQMIILNAL